MILVLLGLVGLSFYECAARAAGRCSAFAVPASSNSSRRAIVSGCRVSVAMMQTGSAALLFVEMTAGGVSHCYLLLLPACAATDAPASTCRLLLRQLQAKLVCLCYSMTAKSNRPRPGKRSRAHRRVLAADRARHQPDAEAALPTPAPLGRKQPLIGANECDAHYITTRRTMDASTATPGSPARTMPACPPSRRDRGRGAIDGRNTAWAAASTPSSPAKPRSLQEGAATRPCRTAKSIRPRPRREGYAAVRERKRQDFILECGDKAPPEPLTELVAMQNPEKPGTWVWSPRLAALLEQQEDHAPVPKHPINLPEYIVDCEDWEWITAIVRSVLLHNIDHFAHTYSAIEKGDKYFMGGSGRNYF